MTTIDNSSINIVPDTYSSVLTVINEPTKSIETDAENIADTEADATDEPVEEPIKFGVSKYKNINHICQV